MPRAGWRPRLVALDIDGTVLDHDGNLPASVPAAIDAVLTAGVPVVLATGRSWHGVRPLVEELGLPPGWSVASNGAVVVSFPPERIVRAVTFDPRLVIERVGALAPEALIAVEEVGVGYRISGHFPEGDLTGEMVVEHPDQLGARPVTRVIVRDPERSDAEFIALADQLGLHGVSYYVGWSAWLDIAPMGVTKASGLEEVTGELGVAAVDVLAIGAADAVTDSIERDGLVNELRRWF